MSLLLLLMVPVFACVVLGWRTWIDTSVRWGDWRKMLVFFGLMACSLSFLLESIFLGHGYTGARSFWGPPIGIWLLIGRANGLMWLFVIFAALLGKGKIRIALLLYFLTSLAADYVFINAAMD